MAFNSNITPGAPPLLWSEVHEAFQKVNENFDILVATIGSGSGLSPINFETLDTSVKPTTDNLYDLGDITHRWKGVYSGEHTTVDPTNGLWAGNAQIKGVGLTVNLPENSTIGGDPLTGIGTSLIIDPDKTFFKEIQVDNDLSVVATEFGSTVNFLSGSGINLTVSSAADSIEIDNTGILAVNAGSGISVSTTSGTSTIVNTGVRSLQSVTSLPSGRTAGSGINIDNAIGDNIKITNTGVLGIQAGTAALTVSTDAATGIVTITNAAPAGNTFSQINVNGDGLNLLVADAVNDILNINSGEGISLSKDPATDTVTFSVNPVFDLKGSVFGDDSSILVDAVSGILPAAKVSGTFTTIDTDDRVKINGDTTVLEGLISSTNSTISSLISQISSLNSILFAPPYGGSPFPGPNPTVQSQINSLNSQLSQEYSNLSLYSSYLSDPNVEILYNAETAEIRIDKTLTVPNIQGSLVGDVKGSVFADDSTILVDAVSGVLSGTLIGNVQGNVTGNIFTNLIDSADSSAITVTPTTIFSSDVTVENDLIVAERLTVKGSRVINLSELKSVVAASSSFADFQTRIAALV